MQPLASGSVREASRPKVRDSDLASPIFPPLVSSLRFSLLCTAGYLLTPKRLVSLFPSFLSFNPLPVHLDFHLFPSFSLGDFFSSFFNLSYCFLLLCRLLRFHLSLLCFRNSGGCFLPLAGFVTRAGGGWLGRRGGGCKCRDTSPRLNRVVDCLGRGKGPEGLAAWLRGGVAFLPKR